MFGNYRRERFVRKTLKRLSKQRVELVLRNGGPWIVLGLVSEGDVGIAEALRTCHMRGWVEQMHDAVPQGALEKDAHGDLQLPQQMRGIAPLYRLTDSGWNQIRGVHSWLVATAIVALASLALSAIGIFVQLYLAGPAIVVLTPPAPQVSAVRPVDPPATISSPAPRRPPARKLR